MKKTFVILSAMTIMFVMSIVFFGSLQASGRSAEGSGGDGGDVGGSLSCTKTCSGHSENLGICEVSILDGTAFVKCSLNGDGKRDCCGINGQIWAN